MPTLGPWEIIILLIVLVLLGLGVVAVIGGIRFVAGRVSSPRVATTVPASVPGNPRAQVWSLLADVPDADVARVAALCRELRTRKTA